MSNFAHLNQNLLCAIDVETTGRMPGYHEILQISVLPLDSNLEPLEKIMPFYMTIAPEYPERIEKEAVSIHHLDISKIRRDSFDPWKVADLFDEWIQRLNLPFRKSLIPLAHNWVFEAGFLKAWLGLECFNQFFHPHPRDTMLLAIAANDRAYMRGEKIPFQSVSLIAMCKYFNIPLEHAHDALQDTIATAKVYRALLQMPII